MLDYLYGKLNKEVEERKWKGLATPEASVKIDEVENTISVDITPSKEMSDNSSNTVENRVIKAYIDEQIRELEARIHVYIENKLYNNI